MFLSAWDRWFVRCQAMHDVADSLAGIDHDRVDVAVLVLHGDLDEEVALNGVVVFDQEFRQGTVVVKPFTCKHEALVADTNALQILNLRLHVCNEVAIPHVNENGLPCADGNIELEVSLQDHWLAKVLSNDFVVV